jgi:hypothetical protein
MAWSLAFNIERGLLLKHWAHVLFPTDNQPVGTNKNVKQLFAQQMLIHHKDTDLAAWQLISSWPLN